MAEDGSTDGMDSRKADFPYPFIAVILSSFFIPLLLIVTYQSSFQLRPRVVVYHMVVVSALIAAEIALGILLLAIPPIRQSKATSYVLAGCWGLLFVFFYFSYLLAFAGQLFVGRVITFPMFLAYLADLNDTVAALSVAPVIAYLLLFFIPIALVFALILIRHPILKATLYLRDEVASYNFNNPPLGIKVKLVASIFSIGFVAGTLAFNSPSLILATYLHQEEPLARVFLYRPIMGRGHDHGSWFESSEIRDSYPDNIAFNRKNVILIIIDSLRADYLDLDRPGAPDFPFLGKWFSRGTLTKVDLAFSTSSMSFPSILSILRSKSWSNIGYSNFALNELLKDQGYKVNFILSGDHTNYYDLKRYYGESVDVYFDGENSERYSGNDDRVLFEGLDQISHFQNNPSFFYFFLMSVHALGLRQDEFKEFGPATSEFKINPRHGPFQRHPAKYENHYKNGVIQAKSYLEKLLGQLQEKGYLENSIVVITADHGESMSTGHGRDLYTDQILIPLLIYDDEKIDYKNTFLATHVDIAPTIVDRLGLPIPGSWEGRSLLSENPKEFSFHQVNEVFAVIHKKGDEVYKYISSAEKGGELYELTRDLWEEANLVETIDPEYLDLLRAQMTMFNGGSAQD